MVENEVRFALVPYGGAPLTRIKLGLADKPIVLKMFASYLIRTRQ